MSVQSKNPVMSNVDEAPSRTLLASQANICTHQLLVLHVDVCVRQLVLIFVIKDWKKKAGQGANKLFLLPFLILFTSICVFNARIKNSMQNFLKQHL